MCGRFALTHQLDELFPYNSEIVFGEFKRDMPPRYNIAPTQPIAMVSSPTKKLRVDLVRWGLVPSWVKDPKDFTLLTNARSETVLEKPSFKTAMRHRRTLVPASGFYEWRRFGKGQRSQPYWVRPRHGGIVTFGGLMETYCHANGSEIDTGCIITTDANEAFREIHHRLPLVIHLEDFDRWLDCRTQEPRDVLDLMQPVKEDYFEAIPVGDAVNKVANSGPEVQQRTEPTHQPTVKNADDDQLSMF